MPWHRSESTWWQCERWTLALLNWVLRPSSLSMSWMSTTTLLPSLRITTLSLFRYVFQVFKIMSGLGPLQLLISWTSFKVLTKHQSRLRLFFLNFLILFARYFTIHFHLEFLFLRSRAKSTKLLLVVCDIFFFGWNTIITTVAGKKIFVPHFWVKMLNTLIFFK